MFTRKPTSQAEIIWLGDAFTWTAGFVDAVGYLTLREIYVANMSGNTVALAIHLSKRDLAQAWVHACPILAFVPGLVAGDAMAELCKRARLRAPLVPTLLIEVAGLVLFLIFANQTGSLRGSVRQYSGGSYALLVGMLAFTMGLQNGALRRVGALRDAHTYVTGMLLATANGCTQYLFWLGRRLRFSRARLRRVLRYTPRHRSIRAGFLAAMLWTFYIVGAVVGALASAHLGINVMIGPIGIIVAIAIVDMVKPVARPKSIG
jgi:uncharacterized membrane protein YoaK (UPF0700 family)